MKILLTGASGFIGQALLRAATVRGDEVAALSRTSRAEREGVRWLHGGIENAPWADIDRFAADVCVHAAWINDAGGAYHSPENDDYRRWSSAFLRRAIASGVSHVLGLGTCVEYRMGDPKLAEDHTPLQPLSRYAQAKNTLRLELEAMLDSQPQTAKLCWARLFYVYGPGEPRRKLCSSLIDRLARGEEVRLSTPDSVKDYIQVDDVASALLLAAEKRFAGPLNIGTGEGVSVERLARDIVSLLGAREKLVQACGDGAAVDPLAHVVADASRLRGLGWRPAYDLRHGLTEMIAVLARQQRPPGRPQQG